MSNVYIHDVNLKYPDKDYAHMILKEKYHNYVYDKDFMYRLKGKDKFVQFLVRIVIFLLVQPLCYIRYALRIKGKKYFREYKKLNHNKKNMITICNHTTEWDSLFVMTSRYFKFPEFPIWQEGAESKQGMLYRYAGGFPMPRFSVHGSYYAYNTMKEILNEGKWLHIFPEAACWAFYPAIRPFQPGAFKLAYELDMPILPMVVKYRKPKGLYKLFKKQPNATLIIGKPITVNKDLNKTEAVDDLVKRSHLALINLLGIESEEENQKIIDSLPKYHVE